MLTLFSLEKNKKVHVCEGYICVINKASAHYEVCIWQHHQCFEENLHCDCSLMVSRVELIPNKNLIIRNVICYYGYPVVGLPMML